MFFAAVFADTVKIKLVPAQFVAALFFGLRHNAAVVNVKQIFNLAAAGALHMMVLADIRIITEAVLTGIKNLDNMQPVQNLLRFYIR